MPILTARQTSISLDLLAHAAHAILIRQDAGCLLDLVWHDVLAARLCRLSTACPQKQHAVGGVGCYSSKPRPPGKTRVAAAQAQTPHTLSTGVHATGQRSRPSVCKACCQSMVWPRESGPALCPLLADTFVTGDVRADCGTMGFGLAATRLTSEQIAHEWSENVIPTFPSLSKVMPL